MYFTINRFIYYHTLYTLRQQYYYHTVDVKSSSKISSKLMEVRVLVPASMVCCLDFLDCVFGSAGDPFMPLIDAGIDETWSGHTGMIFAAPHVRTLKKKDIGLPHWDEATEKQRQDKMCWKNEDELYHDGQAFNLWFRTKHGHAVILVTDSYFGYYKKTVKALLSFASNLSFSEEEHAGGCLAFSSYNLGTWFKLSQSQAQGMTLEDVAAVLGDSVIMTNQGYALDKRFPDVVYVHGEAEFSVPKLTITFESFQSHDLHNMILCAIKVDTNTGKSI
ncbi:hypothetical protein RCL1_003766 [Eukaryota sp. TZLM3-RCL]